jgi:hypothetical protein
LAAFSFGGLALTRLPPVAVIVVSAVVGIILRRFETALEGWKQRSLCGEGVNKVLLPEHTSSLVWPDQKRTFCSVFGGVLISAIYRLLGLG